MLSEVFYLVNVRIMTGSALRRSLQRTLDELKDYQRQHNWWQQQHDRLVSEQASPDTKREQVRAYDAFMSRERDLALGYGRRQHYNQVY